MGKVIGILSGKGGVGKTTIVANLGAVLTQVYNKKTLIIDSNITTSHLGLHLGLYEDLPVTLKEVLLKNVPVAYAIFVHPMSGIRLLPAPMSGDGVQLTRLNSVIDQIRNNYDIIIVDCAPGLGVEVLAALGSLDAGIIVTTPDLPSLTDALKTIDLLKRFKKEVIGLIVNRTRKEKFELTLNEIESTCDHKIISVIQEDDKIPESISKGTPLAVLSPNHPISIQFKKLAAFLIDEQYEPQDVFYKIKKILGLVEPKVRLKPKIEVVGGEKSKEHLDLKQLETEITEEIKHEIISAGVERDIVKKELMKKVREKLKERGFDG